MVSCKTISLGVLVLQTSIHVLTIRYSRTIGSNEIPYLPSTAVLLAEVLKVLACVLIVAYENGLNLHELRKYLKQNIISNYGETAKLIIPSGLYVVQNNLLYAALTTLDAATFQITYQLKILTTAIFATILLGKKLTINNWFSLLLLMLGVLLIQLPNEPFNKVTVKPTSERATGITCVLAACLSSGFAGVYFEKLLKGSQQSVWVRNIQLGIFGIMFAIANIIMYDLELVIKNGFFQGYTWISWIVVLLQAFGGLTVSMVIKFADNILKGFATSISIVFSTFFSNFIFGDLDLSLYFTLGTTIVIGATILYSFPIRFSMLYKNRQSASNIV